MRKSQSYPQADMDSQESGVLSLPEDYIVSQSYPQADMDSQLTPGQPKPMNLIVAILPSGGHGLPVIFEVGDLPIPTSRNPTLRRTWTPSRVGERIWVLWENWQT